jgi:hypothetical protein
MDTHLSTDLKEAPVRGPRASQAEQDARGLLYRRNEIAFF